jgi:hypothetical protein
MTYCALYSESKRSWLIAKYSKNVYEVISFASCEETARKSVAALNRNMPRLTRGLQ